MNIIKLESSEIKECKSIIELNGRRNYIQNIINGHFLKQKYLIVNAFTSMGKSYFVKKSILALSKENCNQKFIIVVPTDLLKQDFETILKDIKNVEIWVINSFIKNCNYDTVTAIYFDEADRYSNENSEYFSTAIPKINSNYKCLLTATLTTEQELFVTNFGFKTKFVINSSEGLSLNLIPNYEVYNIGLNLDKKEQTEYEIIEEKYKNYILKYKKFQNNFNGYTFSSLLKNKNLVEELSKKSNFSIGTIYLDCKYWFNVMNQRKSFFYKLNSKKIIIEQLIEKYKDKQILIYFSTQQECKDFCKNQKNRKAYFGNITNDIIKEFAEGGFNVLCNCSKLVAGQVSDNVEIIIRVQFNTKVRIYEQSKGRALRFDEHNKNKNPKIFNIYVNNTIDESWITEQCKNEKFINYINVDEINNLK